MTASSRPYGIKGTTDHPRSLIWAKAKIGRMSAGGYPEMLDHVIFVDPKTGEEIAAFRRLGDKPTAFLGLLPADDLESFLDCAWKRFGERGLRCRGDGERGVERETGRERLCAGPYLKDTPRAHLCRFARPKRKRANGVLTEYPPECKPVLSLQLLVPLAGTIGVVQLDTGGAASSVPGLFWQIKHLQRAAEGHLAGLAVKVMVRAFSGQQGTCYAWALTQPTAHEISSLERDFAPLSAVRVVESDRLPARAELPPLIESIDRDIYGLPATRKTGPKLTLTQTVPPSNIVVPNEIAKKVEVAEAALLAEVEEANLPKAKRDCAREVVAANRRVAAREGNWPAYLSWLAGKADELAIKTKEP